MNVFTFVDWLDETSSSVTTLMGPSFVRFSNGSEYQLYILSGFSFTQPYLKSSRVPIIRDFCPQYATTGACLSVIGCGMCVSETGNGSFCFDNSGGGMTRYIPVSYTMGIWVVLSQPLCFFPVVDRSTISIPELLVMKTCP